MADTANTLTEGRTAIRVNTTGDLWRSYSGLFSALVETTIFEFDPDEDDSEADEDSPDGETPTVSSRAVDPANVAMVEAEVPVESFRAYTARGDSPRAVGLDLDELDTTTQYARKGRGDSEGDPVVLTKTGERLYVDVHRDDAMRRRASFFSLDPDVIRKCPELPDMPLPWEGQVEIADLRDSCRAIRSRGFDYVKVSTEDSGEESVSGHTTGYLSLYASDRGTVPGGEETTSLREDGFRTDSAIMECVEGDGDRAESIYSLDYLLPVLDGLRSAGVETGVLRLGDEYPLSLSFAESSFGISGQYAIAPRLPSSEESSRPRTPTWDW